MHKLLVFIVLLATFSGWSQQDTSTAAFDGLPELSWHMPIDPDATWDVDQAGNVYLSNRETISRLDSAGRQLLTQSVKSIGTITKIDASNRLKIALFSEHQQQICYLDNALALQPMRIDLAEVGVDLAQQFATSAQTDRIWVFDQLNSELQLITIRTNQRQIVQNLKSLAGIGSVIQMLEHENTLYILGDNGVVSRFDNFGTLIESYEVDTRRIQPFPNGFLFERRSAIWFYDTDEQAEVLFFALPMLQTTPIRRFLLAGNRLFVSTDSVLYCFVVR